MELVEGPTLGDVIKQGPIPLDEALKIADQIAEALAAAHEKLITHRDLKPGNVKVKDDGLVKVLDFGLAKVGGTQTAATSDESPTLSMTLTQAGMILGTAAYMSPEQARGKPVDARSDIWAFGVVLYEMLTARRLFQGEDLTETLASVVKENPDLSGTPLKIRRLLESCLQKDPKKRLGAISDRHLLLIEPTSPPPPRAVSRMQWVWPAIAGAVTLVAAGLAWIHFREIPPEVQSLRYELTYSGPIITEFQLSPDGRYLVYRSDAGPNTPAAHLTVRALDSLDERQLPGTDGATYPFWSPDSAHIAFFAQGKLKQIAVSGGPATIISDAPASRGGTWGPDGVIVFAPTVSGVLSRVSISGGPSSPLNLPRAGGTTDSLRFPAFLPNSNRFFYVNLSDNPETEGVYVASLDGGPPVRVLREQTSARFVPSAASKTIGHILFRRDGTLMAQLFDAATLKTSGEAIPLAEQIRDTGNIPNAAFTVSTNGTLVYLSGGPEAQENEIVWLDRAGKRGKSLLKQKGLSAFSASPDGSQIAYSLGSQAVQGDLWLHDTAQGASQKFTFGPFSARAPAWSPKGGTIVFTSIGTTGQGLFRKSTQTSAKEEALGVTGVNPFASSFSPDGKVLVYSLTGDTTKDDIWLLPMEGERKPKIFKQTPFAETGGQISPDGRWMAFSSDASGRPEVYVESMTAGGAQRQISVEGGASPMWRSDGRELYFVARGSLMVASVKPSPDLTFGPPHELFQSSMRTTARYASYRPSADGSQFLVMLPVGDRPEAPPLTVVTNWQKAYAK